MRKKIAVTKKRKNINLAVLLPLAVVSLILLIFNINIARERQAVGAHLDKIIENYETLSASLAPADEIQTEEDIEATIERVAREQLLLKKEGEEVVIITRDEKIIAQELSRELKEAEDKESDSILDKILSIFKR